MARKYTSSYCDVIRAKIILLADKGLSNDVIAARLDTPRQIVSKWRKRFALARLPGLEALPRGGRKSPLFSPASSFKLRLWPASFLTPSDFRYRASRLRRSGNTSFRKAWSRRSAAPHCGAGSAAMPFAPGNIEAGSSPAIRGSPTKPDPSSIFMSAFGRALHWAPTTTSFPPTKRPAFRPVAGNSQLCLLLLTAPPGWKASIFARAPGSTWPLGMSIVPKSSDVVNPKTALRPWDAW